MSDQPASTRSFTIRGQDNRVEWTLPLSVSLFALAEQVRDGFYSTQKTSEGSEEDDSTTSSPSPTSTELGIALLFAQYAVELTSPSVSGPLDLASAVFTEVQHRWLSSRNIHMAIATALGPNEADGPLASRLLRAYYVTEAALASFPSFSPPPSLQSLPGVGSALAAAAANPSPSSSKPSARLVALFGGQGGDAGYLSELSRAYRTYKPLIGPYVQEVSSHLQGLLRSVSPPSSAQPKGGLDVLAWLDALADGASSSTSDILPEDTYLLSAPVSFPLIGLTQLVHYLVWCRIMHYSPAQARSILTATTGHSQGIVSAVVIASATTEEDFLILSKRAIALLYLIGLRSQETYPVTTLNPTVIGDAESNGEGTPTPMLSVRSLPEATLRKAIDQTNAHLGDPDKHVVLALTNGPRAFVCAGPPLSLYGLAVGLRRIRGDNPTGTRFLPISVPFHSPYAAGAVPTIMNDLSHYLRNQGDDLPLVDEQDFFPRSSISIPVRSTTDGGRDLALPSPSNISLARELVELICAHPVDWPTASHVPGSTHALDFGPGGEVGIGSLTHRLLEGRGVRILLMAPIDSPSSSGSGGDLGLRGEMYDEDPSRIVWAPDWASDFSPTLLRLPPSSQGGEDRLVVGTRMSRLLGKPPLMVAGMTPTTVGAPLVTATLNAGYHIELAGGGHHSAQALESKIRHIVRETKDPGIGITVNILYLNARQWAFQVPLVLRLREEEGLPIEGICVAAGVPSPEVADDLIRSCRRAGISHVSFKPSSSETIRQVVQIAAKNPGFPILLQWTGGRAGGHHSKEDFHQPLLESYALCRRHPNIILIVGSGFGDADGTLPYLTGQWSEQGFGMPRMPVDGILFASRIMVAAEASTSLGAKQAIVDAPGLDDPETWKSAGSQGTSGAGGVISVLSELGEPIHKLATRGIRLWADLDATVFHLPRGPKQDQVLKARRAEIIARLNADFQKPWFGHRSRDNRQDLDLGEMTYAEVCERLMELVYIRGDPSSSTPARWVHPSYRRLLRDWLIRVEERLCSNLSQTSVIPDMESEEEVTQPSKEQGEGSTGKEAPASTGVIQDRILYGHDPSPAVNALLHAYPQGRTQLVGAEDATYFIGLCQRRGQKPVPFIPVMRGSDFIVWFKKDSLWQSEDLNAVQGGDAGRVSILQGPVAVKHSYRVDEPVGEILGNIHQAYIQALSHANAREERVEGYGFGLSKSWLHPRKEEGDDTTSTSRVIQWKVGETRCDWLDRVGGFRAGWLRALLRGRVIVQDREVRENPWPRVFASTSSGPENTSSLALGNGRIRVVWKKQGEEEEEIVVEEEKRDSQWTPHVRGTYRPAPPGQPGQLTLQLLVQEGETGASSSSVPPPSLVLKYDYAPWVGSAPLREHMGTERVERIKRFYYQLWLGPALGEGNPEVIEQAFQKDLASPITSTIFREFTVPGQAKGCVITREEIRRFSEVIGNRMGVYVTGETLAVPMDYALVAAWRPMIRALFPAQVDGDLLRLVHLSNGFRRLGTATPLLREGDRVSAEASITGMTVEAAGKVVEVKARVSRWIPKEESVGEEEEEEEEEEEGKKGLRYVAGRPINPASSTPSPSSGSRSIRDETETEMEETDAEKSNASSTLSSPPPEGYIREEPVMEITSRFLFRGTFPSAVGTFERTEEGPVRWVLQEEKDVAILSSKSWFHPDPYRGKGLKPGSALIFRVKAYVEYDDPTPDSPKVYRRWEVDGTVLMQTSSKVYVRVGTIRYHAAREGCPHLSDLEGQGGREGRMTEEVIVKGPLGGNPVQAFLDRVGTRMDQAVPLSHDGIILLETGEEPGANGLITAPLSNAAYSACSGDVNPIHTNPWIASMASLPGTITHGMWSSAATRKWVEIYGADAHPHRVISYNVNFTGMVLPGDRLSTRLTHVAMQGGRKVISVEVRNDRGETVLQGEAQVDPPTTAYVFTGQGSQEKGMGMDLYGQSKVAKAVWDRADRHFRDQYGISILEIVRENPKEKTVHFGGTRGKTIRETYMSMQYEENGKLLPLFPHISRHTRSWTFRAPGGLLSATQFTQPALTLMEKAAFEEMRSRGLVQPGAEAFAGHSLGEYSALASMGDVLPVESLVDVVFYRGMTMQGAVARDATGRSAYGMCAVNPARVKVQGGEEGLLEIIRAVASHPAPLGKTKGKGGLLEVVNYNVQGWQYVVAGESVRLEALGLLLSAPRPADRAWTDPELVGRAVEAAYGRLVKEGDVNSGYLQVSRGKATIPLPGIDVPFHSSFLLGGVDPFRAYLAQKIDPTNVDVSLLRRQYIPNLTAQPFSISKGYVTRVAKLTGSPVLEKLLNQWGTQKEGMDTEEEEEEEEEETRQRLSGHGGRVAERRQRRAWTLLIELLAYQFASPVQWIRTQDWFFRVRGVEKLIEVGPSPTLCGMATRTLKLKYEAYDDALTQRRSLLCTSKDLAEICYNVEQERPVPKEKAPVRSEPVAAQAAPAAAAAVEAAPAPPPQRTSVSIPDEAPSPTYILRALVAQKIGKPLEEVSGDKTIKGVVGGKSTLQNEILGDVQKEFPSGTPDRAEELPLGEIGEGLSLATPGKMGKTMGTLVSRLVSSRMPPGMNLTGIKDHLSGVWGLGEGRTESVLVRSVTMDPGKRFGGAAEATAWLDKVVKAYAQDVGLDLSVLTASQDNAGGSGGGGKVVDEAVVKKIQERQDTLVRSQLSLLARHLGVRILPSSSDSEQVTDREKALLKSLDEWVSEHGEDYGNGIQPRFSAKRVRAYESEWNWVRQDALRLYYDLIHGRLTGVDRDLMGQCVRVMNRSSPTLIELMTHYLGPNSRAAKTPGPGYSLVRELGQQLLTHCTEALDVDPVYRDVGIPTGPRVWVTEDGEICYKEEQREGVRHMAAYVQEMTAGSGVLVKRLNASMSRRRRKGMGLGKDRGEGHAFRIEEESNKSLSPTGGKGRWWRREMERGRREKRMKSRAQLRRRQEEEEEEGVDEASSPIPGLSRLHGSYEDLTSLAVASRSSPSASPASSTPTITMPYLHIRKYKPGDGWVYSRGRTQTYLEALGEAASSGLTFTGRTFLVTGAGQGSIGAGIVQGLLSGGAQVALLTSRAGGGYFERLYQEWGARGSQLHVIPWNGASQQDVRAVVEYIYQDLGWDLDGIIPFGAVGEAGRDIRGIDGWSEVAHRIMLTNVHRLFGEVAKAKEAHGSGTRPALCILPLSPNHGTFGGDGLYSESKVGLETLLERWYSESWSPYLSMVGAVIGWTRGTGLMNANNIVAAGLEREAGVRTFSTAEMAFNLLGLLHPMLVEMAEEGPVWADLGGGLGTVPHLNSLTKRIRSELQQRSAIRRAVKDEEKREALTLTDKASPSADQNKVKPRANLTFSFPPLPPYKALHEGGKEQGVAPGGWADLRGCLDLERIVVVTGMGEVGPWGSVRTRWEMEVSGHLSLEACVELAWMMGMVKPGKGRTTGTGSWWEDAKTGEAVDERDIKVKYEQEILAHTGIRWIEPELFGGYDPKKKELLQEVVLDQDMEEMIMSKEDAAAFSLRHDKHVEIYPLTSDEDGEWGVQMLRGATLLVPKALRYDRLVAGQIPTGWNAARYGVPDDIIQQVDPVTLYVLVATMEALVSAGITDPYEMYRYVHVSEVGNCIGSGLGGALSARGMYRERYLDKPLQKDILQETFINTMSAWVNMLLISASGPIKTPVGACATAVESVEVGVETIRSGRARVCLVGGFDDFQEEGSYEFGNMGATSNSVEEEAKGRSPREMSRPTSTSRAGFMEAHGSGVEVLMTAALALEMGVPIRAIIGLTSTAMDKEGRSVPAPGQGILTSAQEKPSTKSSPLLDVTYRKRQLSRRKAQISEWVEEELALLGGEADQASLDHIHREAARQEQEASALWGMDFWRRNPEISPLRGALAAWGLGVDDIGVASFHGTSTQANDKNESEVLDRQLRHLGRSPGNPVPGVFQKYLTGHPKGAAAAWMLHGMCQALETGLIPGNRNADNVDEALKPFDHVVVPSRTLETDGLRAALLKSFGFGQVGGEVLLIHPHALFASLEPETYKVYGEKNMERQARAYRYMQDAMAYVPEADGKKASGHGLIQVKTKAPYTSVQEAKVYLDPTARATYDSVTDEWSFRDASKNGKQSLGGGSQKKSAVLEAASGKQKQGGSEVQGLLEAMWTQQQRKEEEEEGRPGLIHGSGVDVELMGAIPLQTETFVERNFTAQEQAYCSGSADPAASMAGRWSAKEAVVKALGEAQAKWLKQAEGRQAVWGRGAGAPLGEIEITREEGGAPGVRFHGEALSAVSQLGLERISISMSHAGKYSVAVAKVTLGSAPQ